MPLGALQHYTIEPSNLKKTVKFYCEVLGLEDGDRPPLGFPGNWLYTGGVATVHLLGPRKPREGIVVRGTKKKFKDTGRYNNDPTYRAAADAAHRAIMNPRCQPWPLSSEKFTNWRTITFNFDPRDY